MAEPTSPATWRPRPAIAVLGLAVAGSVVVRSVLAWRHSVPRLFPDEYIYAALGRSIGHGQLQIRGENVHFPGILEPILAAPIWRLFPLGTAYHLVQVENAFAVSLAAIPIYLLARSLRASTAYSLAVAIYALLVPELVLVSYTSADAVAYPVAAAAVAVAITSLDQPTAKTQIGFIVLAGLATVGRVEYFALAPAYLVAAVVVDGRAAWRRHRIALFALAPAAGLAALFTFGYYLAGHHRAPLHSHYVSWFFLQFFLLAIELGVAIVPGALAGLLGARSRREQAFAAFFGALAILIVAESTKPAAEKLEYKERYLFLLVALAPIACGLYARNRRPRRIFAIGAAIVIAIAATRLPMSEYTAATFKTDSQFLYAISDSEGRFGVGNTSLVIALLAAAAAAASVLVAFRGRAPLLLWLAGAVAVVATVFAYQVDLRTTRAVRSELPSDLRWVDHAADGPVTAVETPLAVKQDLLYALYWNNSIHREFLLGKATATDSFSAPRLRIDRDGALPNAKGEILFHDFGALGLFANAQRVARADHFTLFKTTGPPRLRLVLEGRFWDGWLSAIGRLRAWPRNAGAGVQARFRLSLPPGWPAGSHVKLGKTAFDVRPGTSLEIVCTSTRGPLDLAVTGSTSVVTKDFRFLSARITQVTVADRRPPARWAQTCSPTG